MSAFYDDMALTAHDLLVEFGASVTLTRIEPGTYDPATGTATPTTTDYPGTGAAFNYTQRDIDGTLIRAGDQRVYLSVRGIVAPRTGDTLTMGGTVFQVVASRPLQPALTAILHDVQVRGVA